MNYPAPQYPYPPQQPAAPQAQPQYPGYPQAPGYPPQAQYPPQQYAPPQAPAQPTVPLAQGTIDDFYNQPATGGGPSISWKDKPLGTTYAGFVARDVTRADIQQQVNFQTKQPEFYRDGRPKFVMKVPLKVQASAEFPEGEAVYYVRGQARDELVRAMAEAGVEGAPQGGATIVVTLVQRKPSGQGMNPSNVVQIQYTPPGGAQAPAMPQASAPQQAPQPVQQHAAPQVPQQFVPQPAAQQPVQQAAPQQTVESAQPQPPSDLSGEQQALLARLTGGQQPGAQPQ